jgi:dethiobiotin synthetase
MEGQPLTVESVTQRLTESFQTLAASHDFVVVETAGGIMVPLAWGFHYGDLAKLLKLPVLLVAGSKLGVLNHTLLTMEYLARTGLKIVGCVVNHHSQDRTPATDTNIAAFRKLLSVPVFVLPYQSGGQGSANRDFDEMARYIADSGALL